MPQYECDLARKTSHEPIDNAFHVQKCNRQEVIEQNFGEFIDFFFFLFKK